jgi:hypothetical protein
VGVDADEERPVDAARSAVLDDGLGDGEDVLLVEAAVQRGPTMTRGTEGDALPASRRIGHARVILGDEERDVDQVGLVR